MVRCKSTFVIRLIRVIRILLSVVSKYIMYSIVEQPFTLLSQEDAVGARVCEACHCRCVRSQYTRCPVPTCPGPRVRAKRLRHLPPRWHDLPLEAKRPLMEEFRKLPTLFSFDKLCYFIISKIMVTFSILPQQAL